MRERLRDAEHLLRLLALFAAGIAAFLALRAIFVPAGFGELGHYRSGAIADNRQRALVHAGRAACAECHDDVAAKLATGAHARVGCESCHGALAAHVADPDAVKPPALDPMRLCARCHAKLDARPARHPQVDIESHAEGNSCVDCHAAHAPATD